MIRNKNIYDDASLIKKTLINDLSEEEAEKLDKLLSNHELKDIYEQLKDLPYIKQQFMEYENFSGVKGYEKFIKRRNAALRLKRIKYVTTVAAIFIMALGIGLWISLNSNKDPLSSSMIVANSIQMGEKKATLTFMDGRTMQISDIDTMDVQDGAANIEYKNGEISYKTKKVSTEIIYNELSVPRGGECVVNLEDGTKVWLNADTKLKYPVSFLGKQREVFLEGEAFFDVAKNGKKFVVKTSFGDVHVLGTEFCISAYKNDTKCYTTLVEGKVSVQTRNSKPLIILPGEQVIAYKSGKKEKRKVNVENYVGWKDGVYIFSDESLESIMKTLERLYDVSISFMDEELKSIPFTGNVPRYENISVFLNALVRTGDLKYRIEGKNIVLYK